MLRLTHSLFAVVTLATPAIALAAAAPADPPPVTSEKPSGDIPVQPGSPLATKPLGDALADTNGRIPAPKGVDPGIDKGAPTTGTQDKAVIPPPGTPAHPSSVTPK